MTSIFGPRRAGEANRRLGLALTAAAGVLALSACGAPSGPEGQTPGYHSEPPPPAPPLMGGPPAPEGEALEDGAIGPEGADGDSGVVTFRRADGVMITTMRPIPNPEDMSAEDHRRIYGEPQQPSPELGQTVELAPQPAVDAPDPGTLAGGPPPSIDQAPVEPAPSDVTAPVAAPLVEPAAPPPVSSPAPAVSARPDPAPAQRRVQSDDQRLVAAPPEPDQAAQPPAEDDPQEAPAVEPPAEGSDLSGGAILLALAVLAAVLVLAGLSRNAATRRREAERRRAARPKTPPSGDAREAPAESAATEPAEHEHA